jgi:hypothetical protein
MNEEYDIGMWIYLNERSHVLLRHLMCLLL